MTATFGPGNLMTFDYNQGWKRLHVEHPSHRPARGGVHDLGLQVLADAASYAYDPLRRMTSDAQRGVPLEMLRYFLSSWGCSVWPPHVT